MALNHLWAENSMSKYYIDGKILASDLYIAQSEYQQYIPCMYLCRAIVVFAASFPHAKVWRTISPLDVKHKILNKVHLICRKNYLEKCKHSKSKFTRMELDF